MAARPAGASSDRLRALATMAAGRERTIAAAASAKALENLGWTGDGISQALEFFCVRVTRRALATACLGFLAGAQEVAEDTQAMRRHVAPHARSSDLLDIVAAVLQEVRDVLVLYATELRLPPEDSLGAVNRLLQLSSVYAHECAQDERNGGAGRWERDRRRRLLRQLLEDPVSGDHAEELLRDLGLPTEMRFVPLRTASASAEAAQHSHERLLRALTPATPHVLIERYEHEVMGVIAAPLRLPELATLVAFGPAAAPERIHRAFRVTTRILRAARRAGMTGAVDLDVISIRLAVDGEDDLGEMLEERYLHPLLAEGEFGELLLDSIEAWLASGGNLKATSRALGVHPNTLRYRLRRFEEVIGRRLSDPMVSLETWWALERRRMAARPG